jgi:hypothetical protein
MSQKIDIPLKSDISPEIITTALWMSAMRGNVTQVEKLIKYGGGNVNWPNPKFSNFTPLIAAIFKNNEVIVKILLDNGADANRQNDFGFTPINSAADTYGNVDIISLLLQKGADPNIPDVFGKTPLSNAAKNGLKEAIEVLLVGGAKVDSDAIKVARDNNHNDIARILETWDTAQVIPVFNEVGPYMGTGSMHNEDLIDLSEYIGKKGVDYGGRKKTIKKGHDKRIRKSNKKRKSQKK